MKIKSTLVLALLMLALLPSGSTAISTDASQDGPPAPVFMALNETGITPDSYIYQNNTFVQISYKADRNAVDGLVLLGSGSNLTTQISNKDYLRNFTKTSSLKANSFYEIDLKITGYTYFYAWAWSGSLTNGTAEKLNVIDDSPGHEVWVENGNLYPEFYLEGSSPDLVAGDLYSSITSNVTLQYQVDDPENNTDFTTLVIAENDTALYKSAQQLLQVNMTKIMYNQTTNGGFATFQYTFNFSSFNLPILYFTAYSQAGWERLDGVTPFNHRLTNGFSFNQTGMGAQFTAIDNIAYNVTTYNETAGMSVGYQYRTYENDTVTEPSNWTMVKDIISTSSDLVNNTVDGVTYENSTLKTLYEVNIASMFEIGNILEIRNFVEYGTASNITGTTHKIEILDQNPSLTISLKNNTYSRSASKVVKFEFSTIKGDISSASITHFLPDDTVRSSYSILNKVNQTIDFTFTGNETVIEGNHTLQFNITNTLGVSKVEIIYIVIDQTLPSGSLSIIQPTTSATTTGKVKVAFNFTDVGVDPSGIKMVTLNWGNNITINATKLSQASITYRKSGTYQIELTIWDKAGNMNSYRAEITVSLPPKTNQTNTRNSPVPFLPVILGLAIIPILVINKRKYELSN